MTGEGIEYTYKHPIQSYNEYWLCVFSIQDIHLQFMNAFVNVNAETKIPCRSSRL